MINKTKLRKKENRKRLAKLAKIADKISDDGILVDKQDELLAGLDDGWERIRKRIITLAGERGEWAGYPLPVEHAKLCIEPRHPLAKSLDGATLADEKETPSDEDEERYSVVNHWIDYGRGREVFVLQQDGRARAAVFPARPSTRRAKFALDTLGASQAWSVAAEFTAMARLKTLVTPAAFRYYLLTGSFIESSKRSGIYYFFRKGRPTLALATSQRNDDMRLLCALCLHPIGYYQRTYAGSMVPTDDVIAHLLLMRGDERKFWGKCNQHDIRSAEAGV